MLWPRVTRQSPTLGQPLSSWALGAPPASGHRAQVAILPERVVAPASCVQRPTAPRGGHHLLNPPQTHRVFGGLVAPDPTTRYRVIV